MLALLLVHDLLISKGGIALPKTHGLRVSIEKHKGRLASELTRARLRRRAPSLDVLREQIERDSAGEESNYPRWVRVNALKSSLEDQLETTFKGYERATSVQEVVSEGGRRLFIDNNVPNLLAITQGIDLTKTEAYTSGKIILQDKASCFPAYLLDPLPEDGDVVDGCAAPGNKTTHLAAILHARRPEFEADPPTIFAFEKDSRRAQTLTKMVKIAGSNKTTKIGFGQDFCQVNPSEEQYANIGGLLLDPSCSGSGIVGRDSMPELHIPDAAGKANKNSTSQAAGNGKNRKRKINEATEAAEKNVMIDDEGNEMVVNSEKDLEARLEALSGFQLKILLHALKFPSAKKVTYSTCSIHSQENEGVVMRALASKVAEQRGWRILRRNDQVRGMREWPVRGLAEACGGDKEIAEGCIRSYKGDGHGVMGFFVAGFVRDGTQDGEVDEDGPYMRDDDGRIVRDVTGMPVLKSTGEAVELAPRDESEDGTEADGEEEDEAEDEDESGDEEEWEGFGDD